MLILPTSAQSRLERYESGMGRGPAPTPAHSVDTPAVSSASVNSAAEDDEGPWWLDILVSVLKLSLYAPSMFARTADQEDFSMPEKEMGFDLRTGYGADNADISHLFLEGKADLYKGFGFSAGTLGYRETWNGMTDHLEFHRVDGRFQVGSMRNNAGLEVGGRWMTGARVDQSGLDGAVTVDVSPWEFVHFDSGWRVSRLGANTIREFTVGGAAVWNIAELRVGYRNLDNGLDHIEGPEFGIGVSF